MVEKTKTVDESNEYGDLDDVAVIKSIGGGGRVFPVKLAEVLKAKYEADCAKANDCLAVPKEWLEEKLGYDTSGEMKGRPNAFKRKLNKQHGDLAGEGKIWHCGNKSSKYYTIAIIDATPAEVKKWQE